MPISKASGQAVAPAAKGDLVVGSATNDAAVLGVGTDGQYLTAASTTTTGLQWTTLSAGATINYQAFTSSTTWTVPASAKYVDVVVVGGGTGGQGGRRGIENSGAGGMGGAVTMVKDIWLNGTGTVAITVGAGSNGTAGTATTTWPANSSNAGFSAFGTYCYSGGGIGNSRPGIPGYKGTSSFEATSYNLVRDTTEANWAPLMTAAYPGNQGFFRGDGSNDTATFTIGLNANGFWGGYGGEGLTTGASRFVFGGSPGIGYVSYNGVLKLTNSYFEAIPTSWLTAVGAASAGTSGAGGAAGGVAGKTGVAGGGGTCTAHITNGAGQGGPGAGGGGSWPNPVGGTGGNGGNAGANTGAGGGAGAATGSTTAGTGGTGGNGAAGIVIVKWIS